jgi:16S rRNA G1207 methylase RsmC
MSKTVKNHFEDCKQVSQVIDNANVLLAKCKRELAAARSTLQALKECQHPKMTMDVPYELREGRDRVTKTPAAVIDIEVRRINQLLGDRA